VTARRATGDRHGEPSPLTMSEGPTRTGRRAAVPSLPGPVRHAGVPPAPAWRSRVRRAKIAMTDGVRARA